MSLSEKEGKIGIIATDSIESLEQAKKEILKFQANLAQYNATFPTSDEIRSLGKQLLRKALQYHKS